MAEWLAMGGYASFVWATYGVTALALGGITIWSVVEYRKLQRLSNNQDDRS